MLENVLQAVVAGVLTGSIYGLMCVGLALIFGVMRVINFAQGDFMMLGMYAAYCIFSWLGMESIFGNVWGPYVSILLAAPLLFVVGYLVHAGLMSRVSGTRTAQLDGEGHYAQLILTLGIALILTNGAQMVFGSVMATLRTPLTTAAWQLPINQDLSVFINKSRSIAALASLACIVLISLLIGRSRLGKSLRAAADNPVAATYMGMMSTRRTALPLLWAWPSRRWPAACSPPITRSILLSDWSTSSSCTPAWCWAAWAALPGLTGAV